MAALPLKQVSCQVVKVVVVGVAPAADDNEHNSQQLEKLQTAVSSELGFGSGVTTTTTVQFNLNSQLIIVQSVNVDCRYTCDCEKLL